MPSERVSRRVVQLVLVLCTLGVASVSGQAVEIRPQAPISYSLRHWTTEDGLPVNHVADIAQTPDGYIWLATGGGLLRYNGYEFRAFTRADFPGWTTSLSTVLDVGADGSLWVRSELFDLARIHDGEIESYPSVATVANVGFDIASVGGSPAALDGGESYWLPLQHGFAIAHGGEFTFFSRADGLPSDTVVAVYDDAAGIRWAVTARGAARWDGERFIADAPAFTLVPTTNRLGSRLSFKGVVAASGEVWTVATCGVLVLKGRDQTCLDDISGIDAREVLFLTHTKAGDVWLATRDYIARRVGERFEVIALDRTGSEGAFEQLELTRGGDLWIYGYTRQQLSIWRNGVMHAVDIGVRPAPHRFLAVFEDAEGSLWLGSDTGLFQLIPTSVKAKIDHGLQDDFVFSILEDRGGTRWVGGIGRLVRFGADAPRVLTPDRPYQRDYFRGLLEDAAGRIWVAAVSGLYTVEGSRLVRQDEAEVDLLPQFRAVVQDADGRIWAGGDFLLRFTPHDDGGFEQERDTLDANIWALHSDRSGRLWVGGSNGLFERRGDGWHRYDEADGFGGEFVVSFYEEDDGDLWIGTHSGGLYRLREGGMDHLTALNGLHTDDAWAIREDGFGHLWVSSNNGVARYRKEALEAVASGDGDSVQPLVFTELDGMPDSECNRGSPAGWRMDDGALWFACIGGISIIDPGFVPANPDPPPVHIENIEVDGEGADPGEDAVFAAGTGSISLMFAALSYADPKSTRYRFRLEGYDDGWVEAGNNRRVRYTNLPAGRYTFRVQGANGGGYSDDASATYAFAIRRHYYQTNWFYTVVVLMLGLGAYGAHRVREEKILRRTRRQIADDLHDLVGNRLSGITTSLDAAVRSPAGPTSTSIAETSTATRALSSDIRDTMLVVEGTLTTLQELADRIQQSAGDLAGVDVKVTVDREPAKPLSPLKLRHILFFCKEAVSNAIRHGQPSEVRIAFNVTGRRDVTVRIEDDGRGFQPGSSRRQGSAGGRGLGSLQRRAEELGGRFEIASIPEEGTTVTLTFRA